MKLKSAKEITLKFLGENDKYIKLRKICGGSSGPTPVGLLGRAALRHWKGSGVVPLTQRRYIQHDSLAFKQN